MKPQSHGLAFDSVKVAVGLPFHGHINLVRTKRPYTNSRKQMWSPPEPSSLNHHFSYFHHPDQAD